MGAVNPHETDLAQCDQALNQPRLMRTIVAFKRAQHPAPEPFMQVVGSPRVQGVSLASKHRRELPRQGWLRFAKGAFGSLRAFTNLD
jgi:hypothetical protein